MMHSSMEGSSMPGGSMDADKGRAALPVGVWVHSFEEDADGIEVYRPSGAFPFPPARRGRATLVFNADGSASSAVQGADDRPQTSTFAVTAMGMNRFRFDGGVLAGAVEVVEQGPGILRLRRSG